jgi:hypothetical protein
VDEEERLPVAVLTVVDADLAEGARSHGEIARPGLAMTVGEARLDRQVLERDAPKRRMHEARVARL